MPVDLGYFIIKKPRVSPINSQYTLPPSSQGEVQTYPALSITYVGQSAYSAVLNVTGTKILTLIDENPAHPDNLNIDVLGKSISDLVNELNSKNNYVSVVQTQKPAHLCLFKGELRKNILNTICTIKYNKELEYLIDADVEGNFGTCSVDTKESDFKYSDVDSKWILSEGKIYDEKNITVPSDGVVNIGTDGVQISLAKAASGNKDINTSVSFNDLELTQSLSSETSQVSFQGAPILVDGTLKLKVNQVIQKEGYNYSIGYGTLPEIISKNAEPYTLPENKTFKIRFNSDEVQEFLIPRGSYTIDEIGTLINRTAVNFQVLAYKDDDTKLRYFTVQAFRGTYRNQLRIEDGTINTILGYSDFQAKKGDGSGTLNFLTHVPKEVYTPTDTINSFVVSGTKAVTGNPFIGVNTANFKLYENDVAKKKDVDFFVDSYGTVILSSTVSNENLVGGILTKDNSLFPADFILYADGKELARDVDYTITPEKGWITLNSSAFPGSVYTIDYSHEDFGKIYGEVVLGKRATLTETKKGPFALTDLNNTLIVEVNGSQSTVILPSETSKPAEVVSAINSQASGFSASVIDYCISLSTSQAGPTRNIKIKPCSALIVLGFSANQSSTGSGAEGGEQSLEVSNTPMGESGFVAPSGGDTIIIKNNDVRERYPSGALLKIANDYYEVSSSYLVYEANLIATISEPYTILAGSNDVFNFTSDGVNYSVTLNPGFKIDIATIVGQINAVKMGTAEAMAINGSMKIKLKSESKIVIGNGTANRTLGFDLNTSDSNTPDTYIKITSKFKNTYVSPDLYTTISPVSFSKDTSRKERVAKNSNSVIFLGDQTSKYKQNTIVKFNSVYYYECLGSSYDLDTDKTTINFLSPIEIALYEDALTEYTTEAIVSEGETKFKTKSITNLDQPYTLRKNGVLLVSDVDYEISVTGDIELKKGVVTGDSLKISYIAKRFVAAGTELKTDYTYFDYLKKGSNIKISYEAKNSDNFYIKVQHGTNLMSSYKKELSEKNKQIANSSSSGFPTGEIPTQDSSSSGSDSYTYRLGIIDEKIVLAEKWFSFFDDRLFSFEKERELINGYQVGASDGRVTLSDIEDSVNTPPTRLFPVPDTRPEEQRYDPLRVPALDGINKNDTGTSTGYLTKTILTLLQEEELSLNSEKNKLITLLGMSTTSGVLYSSGSFDIPPSGESLTLYLEIKSGNAFSQHIVVASFSEGSAPIVTCPLNDGGSTGGGHAAQDASYIASQINSACSALGVSPASVSGSRVALNANNSNVLCVYVVSDAAHVGFGSGNCAAIRSRHNLWTGGYSSSYPMPVPGSNSIHTSISSGNLNRSDENIFHMAQKDQVQVQMDEWLPPFNVAFPFAKEEREQIVSWVGKVNVAIYESSLFDNLKNMSAHPLNSLDEDNTILNRISYLDLRISEIQSRRERLTSRISEIQEMLSQESLYDPRYVWLSVLTNKSNGLYAERKVESDNETRRQREAVRNANTLNSINNFG